MLTSEIPHTASLIIVFAMVLGVVGCRRQEGNSALPLEASEPLPPGVVHYCDFGAVGDGKTDDFDAIIAAHEHANETGCSVRAKDGATYYIGAGNRTAVVRTDTDFGSAAFLIDDREVTLEHRGAPMFKVVSDQPPIPIRNISHLSQDQQRIDVQLPVRSLVFLTDAGTKRYIRHGGNQNSGNPQQDVLLVDPEGTIDPSTPPFWDFTAITEMTAYPVDSKPLTIRGGNFTTIANQAPSSYTYYSRGLHIERSRVTVEGLTHLITDEGETGAPYRAFINISRSSDVAVRDCVLTAHKTYSTIGSAGTVVKMGSYDLSIHQSVNVSIVRCTQTTDLLDNTRWPIMGSNGSKNLVYDHCVLSRFDAHAGLHNATIRNSTIRFIAITGSGTFRIENSTVLHHTMISLREDYGSTWDGEVIIRECVLAPPPTVEALPVTIVQGKNDGQHDFGYPCSMPRRIVIDGLTILDCVDTKADDAGVILRLILANGDAPYPHRTPEEIVSSRMTTASGRPLALVNEPTAVSNIRWIQK